MHTLDLEEVKRTLERWRKSRNGLGRIPAELWKMAAQVALGLGVEETAYALRLDATRLRQWMPQPKNKVTQLPTAASPAFVELPPWTPTTNADPECIFDLEDPAGRKLRVCLKGQATELALNLARLFWTEDEA